MNGIYQQTTAIFGFRDLLLAVKNEKSGNIGKVSTKRGSFFKLVAFFVRFFKGFFPIIYLCCHFFNIPAGCAFFLKKKLPIRKENVIITHK
jgi:hypothetical protein